MQINRRSFAGYAAAAAASLAVPAWAQTERGTTRLVVGFPPGGAADALARAMAEPLKAGLGGEPIIVDNRPGAGGRLAVDQVRKSPANGSVLLVSPASVITLAPHLYKTVRYELTRDFLPIAPIARLDLGVYVGPGAPARVRTLADLVQWIHEEPGKHSCGITGIGSTPHLAALLFGRAAALDWQTVPYQGDSPAFVGLMTREIPVCVASLAGGIEHVKSGRVRLLALTGPERSAFMPDVPTLMQAGYDVSVADRHTLFAPRQLPMTTASTIRDALDQALNQRELVDLMRQMSLQRASAVADFPAQLKAESDAWERAVKIFGLSLEG